MLVVAQELRLQVLQSINTCVVILLSAHLDEVALVHGIVGFTNNLTLRIGAIRQYLIHGSLAST